MRDALFELRRAVNSTQHFTNSGKRISKSQLIAGAEQVQKMAGHFATDIYLVKSDGNSVNNFPVQHYNNCVEKNQATNRYFKRTVRIFKNMRNRLIEHEIVKPGVAPSYFIEGMLWNVEPNELFDTSYSATVQACMAWLKKADSTKLVCANQLYSLIRDDSDVCWNQKDYDGYMAADRQP